MQEFQISKGTEVAQPIAFDLHEHSLCVSRAKTHFIDRLRNFGKRIGRNDESVLHLLLSNHRVFSAYDIAEIISKSRKRIQPNQIYRSLEKLISLGVVHRLATVNGFIACYKEGQCASNQFLICTECKTVTEINSHLLEKEIQNSARKNSFSIGSKNVEVLGICNRCEDNKV